MMDVRIGINPISWSNDDLPSLGGETPVETALAEGSRIGYRGFELGNKFPREPEALRAVLGRHDLECVSGWYSGRLAHGNSLEHPADRTAPAGEIPPAQRAETSEGKRRLKHV